jgi:acetyl-CoA/propionyl-CoA carboxylase biotin carboxyl carrier protein
MNTRLQVEHAVTEAVVGIDLVRAQLLVASGEALPWRDTPLSQRGHAIEARVYAEDPARGFLPDAGRLLLYREPRLPGVRVDAGIVEGGEVPIEYDPLVSKVIASGETRAVAIARLVAALRTYPILGIRTNIPFLIRILEHPLFQTGGVDTGFLDREGSELLDGMGALPPFIRDALSEIDETVAETSRDRESSIHDPWVKLRGWRG